MSNWEAQDVKRAMQLLVGDYYGDRPEEKLELIRESKKVRAAYLCQKLGCDKDSVALEIGSGMGFTSKHIARQVKQLFCCDVSASFLDLAQKECVNVPNITFNHIDKQPAELPFSDAMFDMIFSDAVFIHLNLYDIWWYFSEFERVAKSNAKVFINIKNADKIETDKFSQMAEYYRKNRNSLPRLLCWNSVQAVIDIARHFGFRLVSKGKLGGFIQKESTELIFCRR